MKLGVTLTIVLYVCSVGLLALLRSLDFVHGLTTLEMLYGPAITIASAWIIFAIVSALVGRKKRDA